MKTVSLRLLYLILIAIGYSCNENDEILTEYGKLSIGIKIDIESISNGRSNAINTDNFKVTIFDSEGTVFKVIEPLSSLPDEISLPTGEYYVEGTSNNLQNAAFNEPFYFGRTEIFTIDKEEEKTIEISMSLANTQVSIVWSDNVVSDFTNYDAVVTIIETGESLVFASDESRSGYFISSPLSVLVSLSYTKLDGTVIKKSLTSIIDNPLPKTHYRIHVDASLKDGQIIFQLNVDEDVDIVDIFLEEENVVHTFAKTYGGPDREYANGMVLLDDGSIIVAGSVHFSDITNPSDAWVIKLDREGDVIWQQSFGGPYRDKITSLAETTDGGFIGGGYSDGMGPTERLDRNYDFWVFKLDSSGELLWQEFFGSSGNELLRSMIQTTDGGFIATGGAQGDAWIIKLDNSGNLEWEKTYGSSGNESLSSIIQTADGGFIGTGVFGSDTWLLKLDNAGNLEWEKTFSAENGDRQGKTIMSTREGGYMLVDLTYTDHYDSNILELDAEGNIVWEKKYGGSGNDNIKSVKQTINGEFVLVGYSDSIDGDLTENYGARDVWILKIDQTGNIIWQKSYGGSAIEHAGSICISPQGGLIIGADSESNDGLVEGNNGGYDFWILSLDPDGNF